MRNNSFFPRDLDGVSPSIFPMQPLVPTHLLSHSSSFVDKSLYNLTHGGLALQEALNCISKFAGSLLLWFASGSNSNINRKLTRNSHISNPRSCESSTGANHITLITYNLTKSSILGIFGKISSFAVRQLCDEAHRLQSIPLLSLAAALVPPFDSVSRNILAVPMEGNDVIMQRCMVQNPCERGCADLSFSNLDCKRHAVEPRTGIEFPTILDNILAGETNSSFMSEVLVGTGSRTMKIIKIKSLKVYAFGFYVHPYDVCEKLGPKYASISASEVNRHRTFYEDLLREDISMTVRLVVSCNGVKIKTVKDAFEKSLRARLVKTNPHTDYDCLKTFGSLFSQDIPIRAGTTIYFRRTADGHLVTEIGGNQIGTVHSKDLCRAFFDMYIGDVPVCEQTKEEIGKNVATIIRRC